MKSEPRMTHIVVMERVETTMGPGVYAVGCWPYDKAEDNKYMDEARKCVDRAPKGAVRHISIIVNGRLK